MSASSTSVRDERAAADAAARRVAQREFARPLLVEAGAGTGKTSVLVARVVAWCLGPGWARARQALAARGETPEPEAVAARVLDRVVAITFTEAAAAEMEERVGQALERLSRADPEADWPEWIDAEALPAEHADRARNLLFNFDRLRVSTIHAFCRRLLAEHPLEAGVHPRFAVDARGLARAAAAREAVESWLFEAARRDDPELVELVDAGVGAPELESMLDALLASALPPEVFAADPLAPERIAALAERLRDALDAFLASEAGCLRGLGARSIGRQMAEAASRSRALVESTPDDVDSLEVLRAALAEAWPRNVCGRLRNFAKGRFTSKSEAAAAEPCRDALVAAAGDLAPLLRHVLDLDPRLLARLHRLLVPLHRRAAERMRREGQESFDGLLRKARALLERHPEVAARVRGRIEQLLVDEFQDTDASQCALVAQLALAGDPAPRPGLFVVGDPKQSIYGWRNADLAAYEGFRERLLAAGGAVHRLAVNHRSSPALLDEVERAIRPVMAAVPGLQPPFEPLLPGPRPAAEARAGGPPAVEHWIASDWEDLASGGDGRPGHTGLGAATAREAARLAADLARLADEARAAGGAFHWKDVGVLLRTTSDLEVYLEALRRAGIPYTVARDRKYFRRREVVEARALARAVLDPSDQIALVATLRSAWAGVPDAAWRPLWRRGFPAAARAALDERPGARERLLAIAEAAAAEVRALAASVPGLEALVGAPADAEDAPADAPGFGPAGSSGWEAGLLHALDVLVALRRSLAREPAERFVERLRALPLLEAGEAARFLGAWRLANLDRFFRELGEALEASRGDVAEVLRGLRRDEEPGGDWDEGRPQHPSEDAVQVMTIHGAKGLEFEHVYLLQVHKGDRERDEPFRAGEEDTAGDWGFGRGLGRGVKAVTPGFDRLRARREAVEQHERVRTLYVATTRARRRLVLAGHWSGEAGHGVHGELLAAGRGAALAAAVERGLAAGDGWNGVVDSEEGVRFVFLARASDLPETAPVSSRAREALDLERVSADAARLAAARRQATARARRPLTAAATAGAGDRAERREGAAGRAEEAERPRRPMAAGAEGEVAAAVGTAIHALLERFDWTAAPEAEWRAQRAHACASVARAVAPDQREPAVARAERLLDRLRRGPLWAALRRIAPAVVARELPLLGDPRDAAGPDAPVGAVVGAIDLVYRDPESGAWVVADFKTDRVESEAALREKLARYTEQGRLYGRAVASALGLDGLPRFELWLVDAGRIEAIPLER